MSAVDPELAERVLARALVNGGDFAELYAEHRTGFSVSLDDGRIERPQSSREQGASIRVVTGSATYFGHVDGHREPDLLRVAESVAGAVRGDSREVAALTTPPFTAAHPIERAPDAVDAAAKADLLRRADASARAVGAEVIQLSATYVEGRQRIEVFDSEGLAAADDRTRVRLAVRAIARRGDRVETGSRTLGRHAGLELLAGDAPESTAERAARNAIAALDSVEAPSGPMPVVVGNGFGGVLLHEAVGHGLECDAVRKRASIYAGRLGDRLAAPGVVAYDDGAIAGEWGSNGIDDEGAPTRRTTVIEDGRLTSFLYDRLGAAQAGARSTGNGRRQSFRHLPQPRMTNTYFAPGSATPEELIASVDRGLYAVSFGGGQVEPATGDFVFGASEAYLIEGGRVTAPVRGATLIGNGVDALAAVDGIADDLDIASGYCGKGGQSVPAGVGQPHVRIGALTVGGTG